MPAPRPAVPALTEVSLSGTTADGRRLLPTSKRRSGRITPGQQAALDRLWPRWGVAMGTTTLDLPALFGRRAGVVLEVGFGMGEATAAMARAEPDRDLLAVDVHVPGAGALLREVEASGLTNVRVVLGDARRLLADLLPEDGLDEVRVFFPDPWPKPRHHKRRLVTPGFLRLAATRLRPGGRLHLATDWADYAERMLADVAAEPLLDNPFDGFAPRPAGRPLTRFERQGTARGHRVADLVAVRRGTARRVADQTEAPSQIPTP